MSDLPIHFITIVLNGQPFIRYHLDRMNALRCPWHWHIIEGMADLAHDGAWALKFGGELPGEAVRDGRSIDGTAERISSASSISRSVGAPKLVPISRVSRMASSTGWKRWPRMSGPHEHT